jgi:hypothetical protein
MSEDNEYERQRAENIARNRRTMEEMGVMETKRAMDAAAAAERGVVARAPRTMMPRQPRQDRCPARRSVRYVVGLKLLVLLWWAIDAYTPALLPLPFFPLSHSPSDPHYMQKSMVSGGYWCSITKLFAVKQCFTTSKFVVRMAIADSVVLHEKQDDERGHAGPGWSGGWKGLAIDCRLFTGDYCVYEMDPVPEEGAEGVDGAEEEGNGVPIRDVTLHIFRAFDYDVSVTAEQLEARVQAVNAAEEAAGLVGVDESQEGTDREEESEEEWEEEEEEEDADGFEEDKENEAFVPSLAAEHSGAAAAAADAIASKEESISG